MIEWINANDQILPNITLEIHWQDAGCGLESSQALILTNFFEKTYYPLDKTEVTGVDVAGILGPGCSLSAMAVANFAHKARIPLISNSATRPILSDRSKYPGFWRMLMPDTPFCEAWLFMIKSLGFSDFAMIIDTEAGFESSAPPLLQAAVKLNMEPKRPLLPDLIDNAPIPMRGYAVDSASEASAMQVVADIKNLAPPPRFIILVEVSVSARALLCAAHRLDLHGVTFLLLGYLAEYWWPDGQGETSCTVEEIEAMVNRSIAVNVEQRSPDLDAPLTCAPSKTAREFFAYYDNATTDDPRAEGAATADAACAFALLFDTLIRTHGATTMALEEHSHAVYSLAQQVLAGIDFQGTQGRMRFVNGSSNPQQLIKLEQFRPAGLAPYAHPIARYDTATGDVTWLGSTLLPEGKEAVPDAATGGLVYSADGILGDFPLCSSGTVLQFSKAGSTCVSCPVGQIFVASVGKCICDAGWESDRQGGCNPCSNGTVSPTPGSESCDECPAGKAAATAGQSICLDCEPGRYSGVAASSECSECAAGRFMSQAGAVRCTPCPSGSVTLEGGMSECQLCERGSHTEGGDRTACVPCNDGMTTVDPGADSSSLCECPSSTFLLPSDGCVACREGLQCPGGNVPPLQEEGFYVDVRDAQARDYSVVRCRYYVHCPVGLLGSCTQGRHRLACSSCLDSHYEAEEGLCRECDGLDALPLVLTAAAAVIFLMIFAVVVSHMDKRPQSASLLTIFLMTGQIFTALQALSAVQQLRIRWSEPLKTVLDITQLLALDLDVARLSCVVQHNSPILKFVLQLMAFPVALATLGAVALGARLLRRPMSYDNLYNIGGFILLAFFISMTLTVLLPFQCRGNPNGTSSMLMNAGVICWSTADHQALVALAVLGVLAYPVTTIALVAWKTLKYPTYITSGRGLDLVRRHRFLFGRFSSQRYYFGLVLLIRNATVALIPLAFANAGYLQVPAMGSVLLVSISLQSYCCPWRTRLANFTDVVVTALIQLVLLGSGPMVEVDSADSELILGQLLCAAVLLVPIGGLLLIAYQAYQHLVPRKTYAAFLCHHKEGAGALSRWIKILVERQARTSVSVFLDSDTLDNLELLFDTVRSETKNLVVILTPEVLKRVWCAGEIATARSSGVRVVPVKCEGFTPPDVDKIVDGWSEEQQHLLAVNGIFLEMVQEAYRHLLQIPAIEFPRFGSEEAQESAVREMLSNCQLSRSVFTEPSVAAGQAEILIAGFLDDAEALAACQVFGSLVTQTIHAKTAVVKTEEVTDATSHARGLVVLLSRGILRNDTFARALLAAAENSARRPFKLVAVNTDPRFEFPGPEFYAELEREGVRGADASSAVGANAGPRLTAAYQSLFADIALPFSPCGSQHLLRQQVSEICSRRLVDKAKSVVASKLERGSSKSSSRILRGSSKSVLASGKVGREGSKPAPPPAVQIEPDYNLWPPGHPVPVIAKVDI